LKQNVGDMKQNIFILGGRTGGPLLPVLAIAENLQNVESIILGIKGGFEESVATENNYKIEFLPETKFGFLSFKNESFTDFLSGITELVTSVVKLSLAFSKCVYLLLKYRPKLILNAGSFLGVPIIIATQFTNTLRLTKTKIVIHQQDPLPGLANNLTVQFGNLNTAVFEYTKTNFPKFTNVEIIPNPVNFEAFDEATEKNWKDESLANFFNQVSKPAFLIFGGGSGSLDINNWVVENSEQLLKNFRIIHLTGLLQTTVLRNIDNPNYLRLEAVIEDMPKLLQSVNLVLCRAGMGSITELEYLGKNAFLVPLPNSHQEINAQQVKDRFIILEQKDMDSWLETILEDFPSKFKKIESNHQKEIKEKLQRYFQKVQELLD
jgi:UDP-N-acetylglucosamine--N-acetylmuramyl-(pentapeptide) pyrophosphoryl-undecaprenol N-acetylglucosamine transferase